MSGPLRVLHVAAEVAPLVKVGGLADVVGALPGALARRGHDVRVIVPFYSSVDATSAAPVDTGQTLKVNWKSQRCEARLWLVTTGDGVTIYLVDRPKLFHRPSVYGEPDDLNRFLFLALAALALPEAIGWQPHVLHAHDWHAAFSVALASRAGQSPATVLTVHNLAYQGWFDYRWVSESGLLELIPGKDHPLHAMLWSALALGIHHADMVTTVSRTYAGEILTPEFGAGLDPLLRHRHSDLMGITNGLDCKLYDPSSDPLLPHRYDAAHPQGKGRNKEALQRRLGLPIEPDIPLVGSVGRLSQMKGIDIMLRAAEALLARRRFQFVLLGTGERDLESAARALAQRHPQSVAVAAAFDESLARLIYAGSDIFFMPSRFEPCGTGQLIAMRYGSIPVARRTGGLAETILDGQTGFLFDGLSVDDADAGLQRALEAYDERLAWLALVARAMAQDLTWDHPAAQYARAYYDAIDRRVRAG